MNNKIETISFGDNELSIFPDRWGIITSIKLKWTELLYQDMYDETLMDYSKSVKWWIPYMFPNAWPLTDLEKEISWFNLPQHGTWRINTWNKISSNKWIYVQKYNLNDYNIFPFYAEVENTINLNESWINISHKILNNSDNSLPISTWLHPYFRVPFGDKSEIEWKFKGWDYVKSNIDIWSNDWTITFDNPFTPLEINIPGLWTIVIEVSSSYKKFWVRSLPNKNFVCIEPVMWDEWNIVNNPKLIKPWCLDISFMKIDLKK